MSNDPYALPPVCPKCGHTSEDFAELDAMAHDVLGCDWECPCGALLADDDLVSENEWCRDRRDEQRMSDAGL